MRGQDLGNAAIETFDHAVGLRMAWLGQPVLDVQRHAQPVELVLAAGLLLLSVANKTYLMPAA